MVDPSKLGIPNIVVDRLRHTDRAQLNPLSFCQFGNFVGGVHGVVSAIVEEITDVMGLENLYYPPEILLLMRLEFVAAGSDRPGNGCIAQKSDFLFRLGCQVEKFLFQNPLDPMTGSVDFSDRVVGAGHVDHSAQTRIDHTGWPTALRNNQIFLHIKIPLCPNLLKNKLYERYILPFPF
jgi:hypothetical protein